jgi:hypothetical protein
MLSEENSRLKEQRRVSRIFLQNWRSAMSAPTLAWLTQAPEKELAWERMAVE